MIPKINNPAVFQYEYVPLEEGWRHERDDGGFRLMIYRDALVTLEYLDRQGLTREKLQFQMGGQLTDQYLLLMQRDRDWLFDLPGTLYLPEGIRPRFLSRIGFVGYPFLTVYDIAHCSHLPFMDFTGRAARRLTSLLEEISEMLYPYQIILEPTDISWNTEVLTPLPADQMNENWRTTVS